MKTPPIRLPAMLALYQRIVDFKGVTRTYPNSAKRLAAGLDRMIEAAERRARWMSKNNKIIH
ncbi:hypothetical protein D3C87_2092420 [compost metagenome]